MDGEEGQGRGGTGESELLNIVRQKYRVVIKIIVCRRRITISSRTISLMPGVMLCVVQQDIIVTRTLD